MHIGSRVSLTSWHTVPGPAISDAIFKAGVIIIFAAGGSLCVRHDRVVHGVSSGQGLEHHIIWTGAVLMSGSLEEGREQLVLVQHLHLQHIICVPAPHILFTLTNETFSI